MVKSVVPLFAAVVAVARADAVRAPGGPLARGDRPADELVEGQCTGIGDCNGNNCIDCDDAISVGERKKKKMGWF